MSSALSTILAMAPMIAVNQQVKEETGEQQRVGEDPEEVGPVLGEEKKPAYGGEGKQH